MATNEWENQGAISSESTSSVEDTLGSSRNRVAGLPPRMFDSEDRIASERAFHNREFAARGRGSTDQFYSVARKSWDFYSGLLTERSQHGRVLEYGCGPGSFGYGMAARGIEVVGIDISDVAIDQARATAKEKCVAENMHFEVMNAEALTFPDRSFDLIFGTGILHHLDLAKAFIQLARVLKPGGSAVFVEPLGHNPLINLYRRRTPKLRTEDEHPLVEADFALARQHFGRVDACYFHLNSLLATPFRNAAYFPTLLDALDRADEGLFRLVPSLRKLAWMVVLDLGAPLRPA